MLVMQMPDGSRREYRLRLTKYGLRIVASYASYDLRTMLDEAGWRIADVTTVAARVKLRRAFRSGSLKHAPISLWTSRTWLHGFDHPSGPVNACR